jgi:hypothetical protein
VDLFVLRGFLHIVQAESSRIDTVATAKQKETFVSSISHELSRFFSADARWLQADFVRKSALWYS